MPSEESPDTGPEAPNPGVPPLLPVVPRRSNLVRWILVVTLGCSLGLLLVFVELSTLPLRRQDDSLRIVHRVEMKEPSFQVSEDEIEGELRQVIESQLAAFRQNDYSRAYYFAAVPFRNQVSLPAFERMVKINFPVIAQSRDVQFGVILDNGEQALVNATISGASGRPRHYQYTLLKERVGWKIVGVQETQAIGTTI